MKWQLFMLRYIENIFGPGNTIKHEHAHEKYTFSKLNKVWRYNLVLPEIITHFKQLNMEVLVSFQL